MDNGELLKLLTSQLTDQLHRLEDKLDEKLDAACLRQNEMLSSHEERVERMFNQQCIVCKNHEERLDATESDIKVIHDRQERTDKWITRAITGVVGLFGIINGVLGYFVAKPK